MLDELSPAQKAALKPHAAKWLWTSLNTDPIHRSRAKAAVELAYECAGLEAPDQFIWCSSPLVMDLAYRMVGGDAVKDFVITEIVKSVDSAACKNEVCREVRNAVKVPVTVWGAIYHVLYDNALHNNYLTSVQDSILAGVSDSLWESGLGECWDRNQLTLRYDLNSLLCYGQHDAEYLAMFSFFSDHCGLTSETSKSTGLIAVAEECGWWIPCEDKVFISSKPSKIDFGQKIVSYADGLECKI